MNYVAVVALDQWASLNPSSTKMIEKNGAGQSQFDQDDWGKWGLNLRTIDQCKQEAKKAEKSALPNFGRQKVRLGSVWR